MTTPPIPENGHLSPPLFSPPLSHSHRRERHDIPLIVQTCVDEVEKRGLMEVGIYRVAGVLRDVEELRQAFDTGRKFVVFPWCLIHCPLV